MNEFNDVLSFMREMDREELGNKFGPSMKNAPPMPQTKEPVAPPAGGDRRKTQKISKTNGDIVSNLLFMRNQIKLYHWQTRSFADHKATDDLIAALDTAIDTFVEAYMGKYGRPKVSGSTSLHNFTAEAARAFVERQTLYLTTILPKKLKNTDTDLLNIRDEILTELNKTRFLFTLA